MPFADFLMHAKNILVQVNFMACILDFTILQTYKILPVYKKHKQKKYCILTHTCGT